MPITRFAPSPTGYLHIGGVRTALYSWLYARQHNGKFILRIEDTDSERSTPEATQVIIDGMNWLGLDFDEGPVFQSKRFARYNEVVTQLLAQGDAYYCYCSRERLDKLRASQSANRQKPRYDGKCRNNAAPVAGIKPVIRFKNPLDGIVIIDDLVKGKVNIANSELDDLVIVRPDGTPTYNLTVVVDDFDMRISHVIRGDDHLNNTPRQINILRALGADIPQYAHVPMILGEDGARLSKRHGAVNVLNYREKGYLPEALLNYLARLGWSYENREIFSIDQMAAEFSLNKVNSSPSTFNPEKLLWLNQQYIIKASPARLAPALGDQLKTMGVDPSCAKLEKIAAALQKRAKTMKEMAESSLFLFREVEYDLDAAKNYLSAESLPVLRQALDEFNKIRAWQAGWIKTAINNICREMKIKMPNIAQPLRVAVSGTTATPSIDVTLELVGKERTLELIAKALKYINS